MPVFYQPDVDHMEYCGIQHYAFLSPFFLHTNSLEMKLVLNQISEFCFVCIKSLALFSAAYTGRKSCFKPSMCVDEFL